MKVLNRDMTETKPGELGHVHVGQGFIFSIEKIKCIY